MGSQMGNRRGKQSLMTVGVMFVKTKTLVQPAIIAVISGAFLAGSTNIGQFLLFRFFAGGAAFMILAAVPVCRIYFPCWPSLSHT